MTRLPAARACGPCSACCFTTRVEADDVDPPFSKEPHVRCHYQADVGCGIYATRPSGCRAFTCLWLNGGIPDEAGRPDLCGIVVEVTSQLPDVAMVSEVRPRGRTSPRAQAILRDLAEQVRCVVVWPFREEPFHVGTLPTQPELLAALEKFEGRA